MSRFDEALADLNRAVELEADNECAIANRGETYQQMGRLEEALADYSRAIRADPGIGGRSSAVPRLPADGPVR